jgi:hypothetical protein
MTAAGTGTDTGPGTAAPRRRSERHGVVVSYETRDDRWTTYPRDRADTERLGTRLSADALVPLREAR